MRRNAARVPVVLALVVAFVAGGCAASSRTLVVGAIYPTFGPQREGGTQEYRGVRLAADLVNRNGGVHGRQVRVELSAVGSAEGVPDAMRSLSRKTHVILGSYGSPLSAVAARVASSDNVVFWETGAVGEMPASVTRGGHFFRTAPTGLSLGSSAIDFVRGELLPRLNVTRSVRYAVAYVDDVYGATVGHGAIDELHRDGITPTVYPYSAHETNFADIAKRIGDDHTDVLVVGAYVEDGIALRRELVAQHIPLVAAIGTSSSYCMPEFGRRLGSEAVGLFASDKPDGPTLRPDGLAPAAARELAWARKQYRTRYRGDLPAPALAGFAGAWALFHDVLPNASGTTAVDIAAAASRIRLANGALPNGSGLAFAGSGDNLRALGVIEQWVAPDTREVVWPPSFQTKALVLKSPV